MKQWYLLLVFVVLLGAISCEDKKTTTITDTTDEAIVVSPRKNLFQKLDADQTGVTFSNTLKEDVSTMENLFNFDYFYNGAGVGVADLNNDGLQDLFFAGNQVPNALYLNKGDFTFQDISDSAGINANKVWANGVTFADVNADGWLDIYVSQGGPKQRNDRHNLLYINNGDLTFTESAASYGLNDNGISTQAVFFDYDRDGDLDCVVSNENEFYGQDPVSFYKRMESPENLMNSSTHLYKNNGGTFTNVTKQAGMLNASFGLGIAVSDINSDGWLDVYVANDYYVPDAMYINNGNGTFTNKIKQQTNQVSFYGMGVDIADINNDGMQDIFVLDMASTDHVRSKTLMASMNLDRFSLLVDTYDMPYQYMYNSLQLNVNDGMFHNISQQAGISKTDWSWAGLMTDLDYDGAKDIYVTNGYRRYALDNDIRAQVAQVQQAYQGNVPLEVKQKLYDALPSEKLSNIMFYNSSALHFENKAYEWGLAHPSFSNGAAYADLDNDGDLDLVVNNIDDPAFVYKNQTVEKDLNNFISVATKGNTSESFAKVTAIIGDQVQVIESKRVRGYLSAVQTDAFFGIGKATKADTIRVEWPSGKSEEQYNIAANSKLAFNEADATIMPAQSNTDAAVMTMLSSTLGIDFSHKENDFNDFEAETLLPFKQSTFGPFTTKGDFTGDGLEDLFIGGAAGQAGALFAQTATGFRKMNSATLLEDKAYEDMEALFFDADSDGDLDLYVVSGGNEFELFSDMYQDRLYLNDGSGSFGKAEKGVIPVQTQSGKSIAAIDFDKDGDLDLVVGNRIEPRHYPKAAKSVLLENQDGRFTDVTAQKAVPLSNYGIVNSVVIADYDKDGWQDILVVGEWEGIGLFKNNNGVFEDQSTTYGLDQHKGWWFAAAQSDLNGDSYPDFVLGNMGLNSKYKATAYKPFKVYATDFDDNGTFDVVLSTQYNGKEVPARGRECSSGQMPFIVDKFETYNAYANASLYDIYGEKLNTAYQKQVTEYAHMVLLSDGKGGYTTQLLPPLAQRAPITDFQVVTNPSGQDVVLAIGNIYNTEVETPRMDMGSGTALRFVNGKFVYTDVDKSGFFVNADAKSLVVLDHKGLGEKVCVVGINNGPVKVLQVN
ncbi:MAG: VCBS repeat-containing protein [Gilvibacter sp.]|uniref:VCBS repeat-containing protein n=1 Tax=Nonlabens ulvanivorans TaxID=906888 RepID=UPI00329992C1